MGTKQGAPLHSSPTVPGAGAAEGHVRLTGDDRLIAIAQARGDELQPVVVFDPA